IDVATGQFVQLDVRGGFPQFDMDLWISLAKLAQEIREHAVIRRGHKSESQSSGFALSGTLYQRRQGSCLLQQTLGFGEQRLSCWSQLHAAPRTEKQLALQGGFQAL